MRWEKLKVADVCELAYGKRLTADSRIPGDYPVYGSAGEVGTHTDYLIDGPGIIIGRKGSVGTVYYEKRNFFPIDTSYYVIPKEGNDLRFLYYKFQTLGLNKLNSDAAVPGLNRNVAYEQSSIYPPLPTQRRIASILSAYDDLIENNLKRIKLLEEKAFLRYKQIVKSEKMISENKLEDIIQIVKRKPKVLKSEYKEAGEFPIIDQSTDFIGGYTNEKETIYKDLPMIVFGDHTRVLKYINFPFACGADGTQLVKPKDESICVAYLYFELISCNLSNYHYARHFKFLKEQVIKLPSKKVLFEYKEETDKIFNLMQVMRLQNTKLREARDILLPRLMNGEIEV